MPWQDRLKEAAYTSPSGNRLTFFYEDVKETIDKKTTGFNFPDAEGTFVQDNGTSGRRYPLRLIFWGDDHDIEALEFQDALLEKGVGKLEHPAYGVRDVVPFGTITRNDRLKSEANQTIIECIFWETIGLVYPTPQTDAASEVIESVEEYNAATATDFQESTDLDSAVESATFENGYQNLLDRTKAGLLKIAETQENVEKQFNNVFDSINNSIDILIADPLTLAFQTTILIQSPARAFAAIGDRLSAYSDLLDSIISGDKSDSNRFHGEDLFASTYVTGMIISVVNNQFVTKSEALTAAEFILDKFDEVSAWRDANFEALDEVDTGAMYQKLQEAVAITAGFLVEISFTLLQERRVIIDRERTILDLTAEFYGEVDAKLDFFILSNKLTGSEILEVPRGRQLVYYV